MNTLKKWQTVHEYLDVKGGPWVSIYSLVMLLALIKCLITSVQIPSSALQLYGTVLGTFGITKTAAKFINGKNGKEVEEQ